MFYRPLQPAKLQTTSPLFEKNQFSVLRRYSDFVWLYETLVNNNPGVIVPPLPEKSSFGRFENQFIQQRRMALEKCVQKISSHPALAKDPDLKLFLESDNFTLSASDYNILKIVYLSKLFYMNRLNIKGLRQVA